MTLRDVGSWFADQWGAVKDAFRLATTQSFLDWPLWLSVSVGIGMPILLLWFVGAMIRESREGEPDPLGWTIGYGILALLCVLVTFDLWVSMAVWDESDKNTGWLRIGYPIMTIFFGTAFLVSVAKLRRRRQEQSVRKKDNH